MGSRSHFSRFWNHLFRKKQNKPGPARGGAVGASGLGGLPDALEDILDFMAEIRPRVLKAVPDQSRRARIFAFLFTAALENGGEPDEDFVLSVVPELAEADE